LKKKSISFFKKPTLRYEIKKKTKKKQHLKKGPNIQALIIIKIKNKKLGHVNLHV
jgi:hypothetical protein